jgi:hypothetical protein
MSTEIETTTPEGEVKPEPATPAEEPAKEEKEMTIGEADLSDEGKGEEPPKTHETVPLAAHLELKKEIKELKTLLADKGKDGKAATPAEVESLVTGITQKYDANPQFVRELAEGLLEMSKISVRKEMEPEIASLKAKDKAKEVDRIFGELWNNAVSKAPEFTDVANREVIKQLSLLPQNRNKTMTQLLEETYGNAITGKRSSETPRGGKHTSFIFFSHILEVVEQLKGVL